MARSKANKRAHLSKRERTAARRAAARRRQVRRRILGLSGAALAVAALVVLVSSTGSSGGSTEPTAWDLPAMGPTAAQQERVALADFRGRPTVVNFFASWCTACDAELPDFAVVSDELRDQVAFVGVASQETGDAMLMPRRHGVDWWPLARDIGGLNGSGLSRALGARGMPLTAFYSPQGGLLHVNVGAMTETSLRDAIQQLYDIST